MSDQEYIGLIIIVLFIPFIVGIVAGLQEKIVVFRSYDDLWLAFLAVLAPIGFCFAYAAIESKILIIFLCILEILLVSYIIQRTFIDNNRHIGATLLALYTKLPLCGLFICQLLSFLHDITKPAYKRNHAMATLISMILLVPLINRLVKNKQGFLR